MSVHTSLATDPSVERTDSHIFRTKTADAKRP